MVKNGVAKKKISYYFEKVVKAEEQKRTRKLTQEQALQEALTKQELMNQMFLSNENF